MHGAGFSVGVLLPADLAGACSDIGLAHVALRGDVREVGPLLFIRLRKRYGSDAHDVLPFSISLAETVADKRAFSINIRPLLGIIPKVMRTSGSAVGFAGGRTVGAELRQSSLYV